jgi:DNA polymerase
MSVSAVSARRAAMQQLDALRRAGVRHVPRPRHAAAVDGPAAVAPLAQSAVAPLAQPAVAPAAQPATSETSARAAQPIAATPAAASDTRLVELEQLCAEVKGCERCPELVRCRTQTVFAAGSPTARLCFVGEAPGADEDRHGEPFVGAAGQLLNRIIQAMGLRREDVYICNVLKCRPPNNRTPAPDEVANCRGFLEQQIDLVRPEFLCALGAVAASTLLETTQSIGRLRGRLHQFRGIPLLCTYHPAYLLRNPAAKKDVWEDVQILMREMGLSRLERAAAP